MKKILSLFFSALFFTTCLTAMAATPGDTSVESSAALEKASQYAYLDLESATPDMQEKILDARNTIIFSKDWVADGYEGYVEDVTTGEVIETLPTFSSLFPGWDLPVDKMTPVSAQAGTPDWMTAPFSPAPLSVKSASDWLRLGSTGYYIPAASNSHDAAPFVTFTVDMFDMGTSIRSYATYLRSSADYNLGYKNASTGVSLGYKNHLKANQAFAINNVGGMNLAIRASTYSTPGYATMAVDGANRAIWVR